MIFVMSDAHRMAVVGKTTCPGELTEGWAQCLNPKKTHPPLLWWQQDGSALHRAPVQLLPIGLSCHRNVAPLAGSPGDVLLCLPQLLLETCFLGFGESSVCTRICKLAFCRGFFFLAA